MLARGLQPLGTIASTSASNPSRAKLYNPQGEVVGVDGKRDESGAYYFTEVYGGFELLC